MLPIMSTPTAMLLADLTISFFTGVLAMAGAIILWCLFCAAIHYTNRFLFEDPVVRSFVSRTPPQERNVPVAEARIVVEVQPATTCRSSQPN